MDHDGMHDPATDPHGMDPHDTDPLWLEPDPGADGPGQAGWPDDVLDLGAGHHDLFDPDLASADLASADTADLSFAEDYHHLGVDHTGDDDLPGPHDLPGAADPIFGVDPDLHPLTDVEPGGDPAFPPMLHLDPPEPVDGHPWTDPATLGHETLPPLDEATGGPDPAELFEYAGQWPPTDGDGWPALLASADPATSTLARWWSPG